MTIKQIITHNNFAKMKNTILPTCLQRSYRDSLGEFSNTSCGTLRGERVGESSWYSLSPSLLQGTGWCFAGRGSARYAWCVHFLGGLSVTGCLTTMSGCLTTMHRCLTTMRCFATMTRSRAVTTGCLATSGRCFAASGRCLAASSRCLAASSQRFAWSLPGLARNVSRSSGDCFLKRTENMI